MLDIIVPTRYLSPVWKESIESVKFVPLKYKLHLIDKGSNWAEAINLGLKESSNDILIMDDDVILKEETFKNFDKTVGDILGFKLYFPDERIQHAGSEIRENGVCHLDQEFEEPLTVPHVTASLMFINKHVLKKIPFMTEMPGYQFEDVDFNFRALKEGFKIVCLPNSAIHYQGATKQQDSEFEKKASINSQIIHDKFYSNPEFRQMLYERGFLQQI